MKKCYLLCYNKNFLTTVLKVALQINVLGDTLVNGSRTAAPWNNNLILYKKLENPMCSITTMPTTRMKSKKEERTQKPKVRTEATFALGYLLPILVILNFCFDNLMGREEQVSKPSPTQGDSPTNQSNYILNVRANPPPLIPENCRRSCFRLSRAERKYPKEVITITWPYSIS